MVYTGKPHIAEAAEGDLTGAAGQQDSPVRSTFRARLDANPMLRRLYKVGVAVVGGLVLVAGVLMIPYPGPGWVVVFAGLAILATEFSWARRVLTYARGRYDAWTAWLGRRSWPVKILVLAGTGVIVLLTLWLLGALALVAGWIGLDWTWLRSPLF
jgi:uncharacterized protein (TIGR02611 family)